jgi:hypothetical protein
MILTSSRGGAGFFGQPMAPSVRNPLPNVFPSMILTSVPQIQQ